MTNFTTQHPHYEYLRKKWISKEKSAAEKLFSKHGDTIRHLTLSGLGGLMLLQGSPVPMVSPEKHQLADNADIKKETDQHLRLAQDLTDLLPKEVRNLTPEEEGQMEKILSSEFKMNVKAEIGGIRLNRTYGLIGGEQHLYRYPGDNLYKHAENTTDWAMYGGAGIAPGLGAWGYFAPSEQAMTEEVKEQEKYYIAVPTFLAPGFAENVAKYRDFFKFRKMLLVNPKTGQAVVADIGDAGPAEWTGKHLGGSPEVMEFLGLATGPRKGAVLYFFLDDVENKVKLGPIEPSQIGGLAALIRKS